MTRLTGFRISNPGDNAPARGRVVNGRIVIIDDDKPRRHSVYDNIAYPDPYHEHVDGGFRLVFPGPRCLPPGMNTQGTKWQLGATKKLWMELIMTALAPHSPRYRRARVAMTLYQVGTMDDDNLQSTSKAVNDALVNVGVVAGDSPDLLERVPVVSVPSCYRDIRTVVEITESK